MSTKKLYILDVSGYIFRAYFALPPMSNTRGESTNGLFGFVRSLLKMLKEISPDHIVAVFDGPDNKKQRKEIYEKYKANRVKAYEDLPEQIERAKQFCTIIGVPEIEVPGVEADDTIGSIAKWAIRCGFEVYIYTADKDLCQLVEDKIFIINPWKENLLIDRQKVEEIYGVPPERIADLLALMGDTSDNIPGVKGFGPKTSAPLLQQWGSLENLLENIDKLKGAKATILAQEAENARLSKRLATIYTDIEFPKAEDFFTKKSIDLASQRSFYLEMGFTSLVKELDALNTDLKKEHLATNYTLVNDELALNCLKSYLKEQPQIAIEILATSTHPIDAEAVGISFCAESGVAYYLPFNGDIDFRTIVETLNIFFRETSSSIFGHNIKLLYHTLQDAGITPPTFCFDTVLAAYILSAESRKLTQDHLFFHYFEKVKTPLKALLGSGKKEISMKEVPLNTASLFACESVDFTFQLKTIFKNQLEARHLSSLLFDLELPLSIVLAKMERSGIFLDIAVLCQMSQEIEGDIARLRASIFELAGEEFNISSTQQLSKILFEKLQIKPLKKTATGLSTNADVLEMLKVDFPIAGLILEYRTLEKLRSTYIDALPLEVNQQTKRIHPTFNQFVTATGRLSCQNPNLQNIPVRTAFSRKIRTAFRPQKEGWSFLGADYSQIELRLLAHLSGDEKMIEAFNALEDIHTFTASLIFNTSYDKVTKEERTRAKAINFGIVYGQQAFGLSQELGIDVKQAGQFIAAYFERYPRVLDFISAKIEDARRTGKTITMTGRERDIAEIHSNNAILRQAAERLAVNTPLQGSAADLIKLAMLKIDALLTERKMQSYMILQIHDELIFEAPDHELASLKILVKETMEGIFSLKVPLSVNVNVGKNWGEC